MAKPPKSTVARFLADLDFEEWERANKQKKKEMIRASDLSGRDKKLLEDAVESENFDDVRAEVEAEAASFGATVWIVRWIT